MQIGCFKEDGDGFAGRLRTLTLDVALRLVPTGFTGHDRAPDWRVHLADNGAPATIGPEVGSGWNHDAKTGALVTPQLDCQGLPRPSPPHHLPCHSSETRRDRKESVSTE